MVKPKTKYMTEEEKQSYRQMRAQGLTLEQMSKKTGRHPVTICQMLVREAGTPAKAASQAEPAKDSTRRAAFLTYEFAAVNAGKKTKEQAFDAICNLMVG